MELLTQPAPSVETLAVEPRTRLRGMEGPLVEGPLDVSAAAQTGWPNATLLEEDVAEMVRRQAGLARCPSRRRPRENRLGRY
jgi:hypothetical protein